MKGFTILELLIVMAITVALSSLMLIIGVTRNTNALSVETAKIASVILQAKQLSIATYGAGPVLTCGYGVYFNLTSSTYSLFVYSHKDPNTQQCLSLASTTSIDPTTADVSEYSGTSWNLPLANGVVMQTNTSNQPSAAVVLFYPPNPITLLGSANDIGDNGVIGVSSSSAPVYVYLSTAQGNTTETISINSGGQVSYQ